MRHTHAYTHTRLTVTRRQCRSRASVVPSVSAGSPRSCASLCMPDTLTMSMSLSQQNDWIRVKWICKAMSSSSSSSMARRHKTTLSGSLQERGGVRGRLDMEGMAPCTSSGTTGGREVTRPTVHQECASPPSPPAARLPGRPTMQILMAVGEGAQGSKLMGLPCQNKSHKTSNLQCQGSAASLPPNKKSQRNVTLHSPIPRALGKSP